MHVTFFFLDEDQLQLALTKEPKVTDVANILSPYGYRWHKIGTALKVRVGFLEDLREGHGRSDLERLDKILQSWIDTRCSEVSWNHIKEILAGSIVNSPGIANDLGESVALFKLIHKSRLERHTMLTTLVASL